MPQKSSMGSRIGSIISISAAALGIVLFFFPWTRFDVKHDGKTYEFVQASGWELMVGELSEAKDLKNAEKGQRLDLSLNDWGRSRAWFVFGLLLPLAAILFAVLGALGKIKPSRAGLFLLILGGLGVGLMLSVLTVDFVDDFIHAARKQAKRKLDNSVVINRESMDKAVNKQLSIVRKEMKEVAATKTTSFTWTTLGLYCLVMLGGGMCIALAEPKGTGAETPPPGGLRSNRPSRIPRPRPGVES